MVKKYLFLILLCFLVLLTSVSASGIISLTPAGYSELVASPALPFVQYTPYYDNQELNYGGWNFYDEMLYGITAWTFYADQGETGSFTVHFYDNSSLEGSYSITNPSFLMYNVSLTFDGDTVSRTQIGVPGEVKMIHGQLVINSTTNSTGVLFFWISGGTDSINVFVPLDILSNPISGLDYSKSTTSKVSIEYYDVDVARGFGSNAIQIIKDFVTNVIAFFSYSLFIIFSIFYWFKFIFIDNFLLTVSFYILGTFALSVASAKDPFTALKNWWGYQKKLMEFFLWLFELISTIAVNLKNLLTALTDWIRTLIDIIL